MFFRVMFSIAVLAILAGCASSRPFEPSARDRLSGEEKQALTLHARHFLSSQSEHFRFSEDELEIINHTRPRIKEFYTGRKEGRLSFEWEMPDKQVFAIATGRMTTTRDWRVSIVSKAEVIYIQKRSGESLPPPDIEEFKSLR